MVASTEWGQALPQKPQSAETVALREGVPPGRLVGVGVFVQTYFLNYLFVSVRRMELENAALSWFLQSPCVAS